jgi:UDP-GlcNAc:undecaprenyl-phosphate GlcNAc-1-phosphate transferase
MENFYFHFFRPEYRIIAAFTLAIVLCRYLIPIIIHIARLKKLFDVPGSRTSHIQPTPTLGGLGIYTTILVVSLTLINTSGMNGGEPTSSLMSLPPIIAGFTLISFIGFSDDMLNISAWKKLFAEFMALFILVVIGDVRITSMQGMFNIGELNYPVSLLISLFAGLVIINAFNLIDGIDGLASSITILGCAVFGIYFLVTLEWEYSVLTFTILGALIPFFIYNTFGKKNKIFMGDSGSLLLGFAMTVLVFRFNEMNCLSTVKPHFIAGPAFSFAVLIVPLFDTLRVIAIRVFRGVSPFHADRRHIHHLLVDMGFSHLQTTMLLISINLLFITFVYFFNYLGNSNLVFIMIAFATSMSLVAMRLKLHRLAMQKKLHSVIDISPV